MSEKPSLFAELKRRNVYKVAVAYAVVGWLLIQVATQTFPFLEIPNWAIRLVIMLVAIGFPIAVVLAWAFESTPAGIKRTSAADAIHERSRGRSWIYILLVGGLLSVSLFFVGRYSASKSPVADSAAAKSIAVLPFESLSDDKANAYFATGMQDEILTRLAKIADLKVISRTSTQQYGTKPGNLSLIAKELGVAHILEGSVQKVGEEVRVNVQLINALKDSHVWADTYDRKLTDILAVETEIAKTIADALRAKLTGTEEQALAMKPTTNADAYDAYLRGVAAEGERLHSVYAGFDAAAHYERAVRLDPNFATAWARLSRVDSELFGQPDDPTDARRAAAKRALDAAQRLQPDAPDTLLALADYQFLVQHDNAAAQTTYLRVRQISPGTSAVPWELARIARREGRWEEGITYFEQALALDPRNTELLVFCALGYSDMRRFEQADKILDRALLITPNDVDVMATKAGLYQAQGKLDEAARMLSSVDVLTPSVPAMAVKVTQLWLERKPQEAVQLLQQRFARYTMRAELEKGVFRTLLAFSQRFAGDQARAKATAEQARDLLVSVVKAQPENDFAPFWLSRAHALLGENDSAYAEADRVAALTRGSIKFSAEENVAILDALLGNNTRAISAIGHLLQIPYFSSTYATPITPALLRLDPIWDPLRNDPRFQKLCEEPNK